MKGKNPNITPIVGQIKGTKQQLLNWNSYGIIVGPGHSANILNDIQHRRKTVKQNMIIVVGEPGEGKSYFALRLAQILDKYFDPDVQVAFERLHLLNLIGYNSPLKMGQVIVIDEAQFIAGARRWYDDVQKDVMDHLEAIRSKGFVIIIVALNLQLMDKIIRKYVLNKMMELKKRGFARVYKIWTPQFKDKTYRKTLGDMSLKLPDFELCNYPNCLICKHLDGYSGDKRKCITIRAVYERRKRAFLNETNRQSKKKAEVKERRKLSISIKDMIQHVINAKDQLRYNKKGNVEPESIRMILEKKDFHLSDALIKRISKRGTYNHPEIFKKEKMKNE